MAPVPHMTYSGYIAGWRSVPENRVMLEVGGLRAAYRSGDEDVWVVRGVNRTVRQGEIAGMLGESGSGKTTAVLALLGLMPAGATVKGSVLFDGLELAGLTETRLQDIRGARISFIPQEALLNLNPVLRVVDQVAHVVRAHRNISRAGCRSLARSALEQAGLRGVAVQEAYPHQLSGGQRQRVLIAQAIVCQPALVIADEPTASLDAVSSNEILALLCALVRQAQTSLLLITHDPWLLAARANHISVMYAGRIIESGPAASLLNSPLHPYTRALLNSMLPCAVPAEGERDRHVPAIQGSAPDLRHLPPGCSFEPRCPNRFEGCSQGE